LLWTLIHHRNVFNNAYWLCTADGSGARQSSKRTGYPKIKPKDDPTTGRQLGQNISDYYQKKGKGERSQVDILDRDGVIYYFVYQQDAPETSVGFLATGKLGPQVVRKVFNVIFWFDPTLGELSTVARGGKSDRDDLDRIFSEVCLGVPDLPNLTPKPVYTLSRAVDLQSKFLLPPDSSVDSIRVKSIRLTPSGMQAKLEIQANAEEDARNLIQRFQVHNPGTGANRSLEDAFFQRVEFEVRMKQGAEYKPRWTFTLSYPNRCNLGENPEHKAVKQYLRTWGIESVANDGPD
jgi:hypothetical protein